MCLLTINITQLNPYICGRLNFIISWNLQMFMLNFILYFVLVTILKFAVEWRPTWRAIIVIVILKRSCPD